MTTMRDTDGPRVQALEDAWIKRAYRERVREDFSGGVRSGVNGTPTFFINGRRHEGAFELDDLVAAIDSERQLGNLSSAIRLFVLDHYKARIGVHADGRPAPREMMMMPPSAASVMRAE